MRLLILFFLFPFIVYSQPDYSKDIKNFEKLNSKTNLTSEEIGQMIEVCSRITDYDPEKTSLYLEKVRMWIEKKDDIKNLNNFSSQITINYLTKREPEKGLNIIRKLYDRYHSKLDTEQQIHLEIAMLVVLEAMNDYEECLILVKKIFPKLEQLESESKNHYLATVYSIRGNLFKIKGKYEEAAYDYLNALRLYEEDGNTMNVITMYNRLGLLYQEMNDYGKSISYYTEGIRKAEEINSEWNLATLYLNIGSAYKVTKNYKKALDYENKALKIVQKNDIQADIPRIHSNIGEIYLSMKDFPKALEYIQSSLKSCYDLELSEGIMYNYISLGKIYSETNQYSSSFSAYDSAFIYVKKLVLPRMEVVLYKEYSDLYKKTGNTAKALEYYIKFHDFEKELFSEEKQEAIARLEIEFKTELKDREIERTNSELKTKEAENKILFIGIISVVSVAGFVVFFLIYRNRILKDLYRRNVELMNAFNLNTFMEEEQKNEQETDDSEDNLKEVFKRLVFSLENDRLYTDSELSLSKVCEKIKSNEKYVSSSIAVYAKTNFNNFINLYRINEAKQLMYETNNLNLNEVSYACGFNSRTTFYNAFKKHTGMSPKQFKEMS